jgi:transmembrane sensor
VGLHRDIEKAAAEWMVRRERASWSESEQARLDAWLSASAAHRVAFIRLQTAWADAERIKLLAKNGLVVPETWRPAPPVTPDIPLGNGRPDRGRARSRLSAAAVAASLMLVTGLAGWHFWSLRATSYRTDVGGLSAISIKDGSTITLNTDSDIRIALSGTERRVELDRGEAFFEVAKDPERPFVVEAGDKRVIAVGTKFSVRRERNNIRVIVTEGRVRVEHSGASRVLETAMISPGAVAVAGAAGVLVQDKPLADAEERLSWRKGTLVFHDTQLTEAVAEFNRYNTQQIDIEDREVGALRVGGQFRSNNARGFVRLLAEAFPIQVDARDDRIVLRHR